MPYVEMIVKIVSKRSEMDINAVNRSAQYNHFKDQLLKIPSVNYIKIEEFELLE